METNWKERKEIVAVLALAVVGIWGYVGYTVVLALDDPGDTGTVATAIEPVRTGSERPPRSAYTYSAGFRDPFLLELASAAPITDGEGPAPEPEPEEPEPTPPQVRLLGVVNRTATVELPSGAVAFVRRGDEVDGARVTAVSGAGITLRKDGETYDVPLR